MTMFQKSTFFDMYMVCILYNIVSTIQIDKLCVRLLMNELYLLQTKADIPFSLRDVYKF